MPYTLPTAAEFKTRFSTFAELSDEVIEAVQAEAARYVDESWTEADYPIAVNLLTAHFLAAEGALDSSFEMSSVTGPLKSESIGDASMTYASPGDGSSSLESTFSETVYGQRFLTMRRVNKKTILVV